MRHARAALVLAALMGVAGLAAQAEAAGAAGAAGRALLLAQGGSALGADEAAALVRSASGGRILGVRRVNGARGPAYEVKVLLDGGRVRVYVVDATSGQILP
jgi:uncharacterized membrane protein YkoI